MTSARVPAAAARSPGRHPPGTHLHAIERDGFPERLGVLASRPAGRDHG